MKFSELPAHIQKEAFDELIELEGCCDPLKEATHKTIKSAAIDILRKPTYLGPAWEGFGKGPACGAFLKMYTAYFISQGGYVLRPFFALAPRFARICPSFATPFPPLLPQHPAYAAAAAAAAPGAVPGAL